MSKDIIQKMYFDYLYIESEIKKIKTFLENATKDNGDIQKINTKINDANKFLGEDGHTYEESEAKKEECDYFLLKFMEEFIENTEKMKLLGQQQDYYIQMIYDGIVEGMLELK